MKAILISTVAWWTVVWGGSSAIVRGDSIMVKDGSDGRQVVAAFVEQLKNRPSIAADHLARVEQSVQQAIASPSEALTRGLIALYPDYGLAMRSADEGDGLRGLEPLRTLAGSEDKFLAADASFYLARALVNLERYEEALPLLTDLTATLAGHSTQASNVAYFLGVVHAGLLNNEQAISVWVDFLEQFPDAPERLRVSAWRQVQQLQAVQAGQLEDVHQRMDFSRRRLEIIEPGERTQVEQDEIVRLLAKLIKEEEKKECSSCSGKKNSESEQQPSQRQPQSPQENSQSQQGGQSNVANGRFVDRNFDAGFDSEWSRLRDRSRDPANAGLKDKLPARYRDIVERYFDAVNDNR